jgi:hypothetical protein
MRYLLIACVLSVGWFGLYALARELASPPLTLLPLQHLAALRRRPKNFARHSSYGPSVSSPIAESKPPFALSATEVNNSKPFWVEALMPARVHSGPTVETPIIERDAVNTPLRVTGHKQGCFSGQSEDGSVWMGLLEISRRHCRCKPAAGRLSDSIGTGSRISQCCFIPATRCDENIRYRFGEKSFCSLQCWQTICHSYREKSSVRSNARTTRSTTLTRADRPPHLSTGEMASLLERSFSGY